MSDLVLAREGGAVTVSEAALQQIVLRAAGSVSAARVRKPRRGLEVALEDGRARVALELEADYGAVLPEVAGEVQARVADALASMCGLEAVVDVSIEELR